MGCFKLYSILSALSLALMVSNVESAVLNAESHPVDVIGRAVPVPSNQAGCSSYLASVSDASTITKTKTVTKNSKATTIQITITDQQGKTVTLSPTAYKTITSTLTKFTETSTGPIVTSTKTINGPGTTTITETALVASPTTILSKRSSDLEDDEEVTSVSQVYKRAQPYYDSPIVQTFLKRNKKKIITEACEDSLYGDGPIPTPTITSTITVTKTKAKSTITSTAHVTSTGDQTKTLPTTTITQTQTSTLSTISVAPGSTKTITTSTGQETVTEKVPPAKITGHVIFNGNKMNDFTDEMGLHFTGNTNIGTEGTYVFDVATGHILDITQNAPSDAYLGAIASFSPTWFGKDPQPEDDQQPALISCSLKSIISGPLKCSLEGQSDTYYFGDCDKEGAMMFANEQGLHRSVCSAADLTFDILTFN